MAQVLDQIRPPLIWVPPHCTINNESNEREKGDPLARKKATKRTRRINRFSDFDTLTLLCRQLVHQWNITMTMVTTISRQRVYGMQIDCERCPMFRKDWVSASTGELVKREYGHYDEKGVPRSGYYPGYLVKDIPAWGGRIEFNNNARLELAHRTVKGAKRGKK